MSQQFEDGPPMVQPRAPRQSEIREIISQPGRYLVSWNSGGSEREVSSFLEALALYVEVSVSKWGATITNVELCDVDTNGLTELQEEAIEAADEFAMGAA